MHSLDDRRGKRLGDIADSKADDLGIGIFRLMVAHAVGDFGKEVACADLGVVFVYVKHCRFSVLFVVRFEFWHKSFSRRERNKEERQNSRAAQRAVGKRMKKRGRKRGKNAECACG